MRTAATLLMVLCTSCVLDSGAPEVSDTDSALTIWNRIVSNRIVSNKILASTLATAELSESTLNSHAMLETEERRDVLSVIVECALVAGHTLTLTAADGASYQFTGQVGLAPDWSIQTPTVSERRWVTACVLARANLYGVAVPISMRHDQHLTLAPTDGEQSTYYLPEGAFYGDLFQPDPVMYACGTRMWTEPVEGTPRYCALSSDGVTTDCGFTYTGTCTHKRTCNDTLAPYGGCDGGTTAYNEIITVFLHPSYAQ